MYNWICSTYNVKPTLDVCANAENSKCGTNYISKEEDALCIPWTKGGATSVFMNPPNSDLQLFIKKAYHEWKTNNLEITALIPTGVIARKHFRTIWELFENRQSGVEIHPLFDRPTFLDHGEKPKWTAREDYMVVIFRKREWEKLG